MLLAAELSLQTPASLLSVGGSPREFPAVLVDQSPNGGLENMSCVGIQSG